MVGRLVSFWDGHFSGSMIVLGSAKCVFFGQVLNMFALPKTNKFQWKKININMHVIQYISFGDFEVYMVPYDSYI